MQDYRISVALAWWRRQMETFLRYWPFVQGIHRPPVNSPHKGQWRGALMFTLIRARINGWVNNREAGDLRRNRVHYDVNVMAMDILQSCTKLPIWGYEHVSFISSKIFVSILFRKRLLVYKRAVLYHGWLGLRPDLILFWKQTFSTGIPTMCIHIDSVQK